MPIGSMSLLRVLSQKQVGGKVGKPKTSNPAFPMSTLSLFKWRHFLPEIILLNVRWYCRYPLSYRNLEEMMQERGVEVDHKGAQPLGIKVCSRVGQANSPSFEANERLVASG